MKRKFHHDKRGAGMVTVLVAMFVILAMGATLLYTSVTGFEIKGTDRDSVKNFYQADTVMSILRANLQQAATESISKAYTKVLNEYAKTAAEAVDGNLEAKLTEKFQTAFRDAFLAWKTADGEPLFTGKDGIYQISEDWLDQLQDSLISSFGWNVTLIRGNSFTPDDTNKEIVIRGLSVTYKEGDLQTDITTDVVISYPPFSYSPGSYDQTELLGSALIANGGLVCNIGTNRISGDVYVGGTGGKGGLDVKTAATEFEHEDGMLICGSDSAGINISCGGKFVGTDSSEIWAPNVTVQGNGNEEANKNSSFSSNKSLYVLNDLKITGSGASVSLSGEYVGFGSSTTNPDQSSSIVVSGLESGLDMSGLNSLLITGQSFIVNESDSLPLGQSITTKGDQLVYLVPSEYVVVGDTYQTNPIISTTKLSEAEIAVIQSKMQSDPLLSGLNAKIRSMRLQSSNGNFEYLFISFDRVQDANTYFQRYFEAYPEKIDAYIGNYLSYYRSIDAADSTKSLTSLGITYGGELGSGEKPHEKLEILPSIQSVGTQSGYYTTVFTEELSKTMMAGVKSTKYSNPFDFHVSKENIEEFAADPDLYEFKDPNSGETIALLATQDVGYDSTLSGKYPELRMIICTGNVTVSENYNGLIIAQGNVKMNNATIEHNDDISAVLRAENGGTKFQEFLRNGSYTEGGKVADAPSWDVEQLVVYRNWGKNNSRS